MDANLSILNWVVVKKRKMGGFLDSLILLYFIDWGPKELAERTNFPISLKDNVCQYVVESP